MKAGDLWDHLMPAGEPAPETLNVARGAVHRGVIHVEADNAVYPLKVVREAMLKAGEILDQGRTDR